MRPSLKNRTVYFPLKSAAVYSFASLSDSRISGMGFPTRACNCSLLGAPLEPPCISSTATVRFAFCGELVNRKYARANTAVPITAIQMSDVFLLLLLLIVLFFALLNEYVRYPRDYSDEQERPYVFG